jgi:hypothetical protein
MSPFKHKKTYVKQSEDARSQNSTTQTPALQTPDSSIDSAPVIRMIIEQYRKAGRTISEKEAAQMAFSLQQFCQLTYHYFSSSSNQPAERD